MGTSVKLQDGLIRLTAPNPSPMTYNGTNTYILGKKELIIIDPGPNSQSHLHNLIETIPPKSKVTHILITHSHLDHSELAPDLSRILDAPTFAYGKALDGQSKQMNNLVKMGLKYEAIGVDHSFKPDYFLMDQEKLVSSEWEIIAHHTPGHLSNHICYQYFDYLFTGDHIMDWSTSVISSPEGDISQFMNSCKKLCKLHWKKFYPGHGFPVESPNKRLIELMHHRMTREAEIINILRETEATISQITKSVYFDINKNLITVASRNVKAHLIDLIIKKQVQVDDISSDNALFSLI
jgi:glyoxylase-like metal-dependent hydrolase (beta-lactamase superfamily II)